MSRSQPPGAIVVAPSGRPSRLHRDEATSAAITFFSRRRLRRRLLSPTLFAVIALAFFLPFATVSCNGATTHATGIQLVTHTVPDGGRLDCLDGDYIGQCVEHRASNTATVAFTAALLGLVLGLLGIVRGPGWCALVGFVSMILGRVIVPPRAP